MTGKQGHLHVTAAGSRSATMPVLKKLGREERRRTYWKPPGTSVHWYTLPSLRATPLRKERGAAIESMTTKTAKRNYCLTRTTS